MPSTSHGRGVEVGDVLHDARQPVEPRARVGPDVGQTDVARDARHPPLAHGRNLPGR